MPEVLEKSASLQEVQAILEDPQYQGNPLLPYLKRLYTDYQQQQRRLHRLLGIADGFNNLEHVQYRDLVVRHERQLRRLEKIARISDLNQRTIMELNARLREAAAVDSLTGLPNRRYGGERMQAIAAESKRSGAPFALISIDVDHFKLINDRYGHAGGDQVLRQVAETIPGCLRQYDVCARWGGEEFLVLLPNTTETAAVDVAQRILVRLRELSFVDLEPLNAEDEPAVLRVTVSAGVTVNRPDEPCELTLQRSDRALYRSKAEGRDRVTVG